LYSAPFGFFRFLHVNSTGSEEVFDRHKIVFVQDQLLLEGDQQLIAAFLLEFEVLQRTILLEKTTSHGF
jgi:hypothetical protein